jgi:VTC domain-containing protein
MVKAMSAIDRLQSNRWELKYLIDEESAARVRQFVSSYLEPDENNDPNQKSGYPVYSLYLDTPDRKLYWQTIQGQKNRFKLRIRFYNDDPEGPAFLEIKRRVTTTILKKRVSVRRDGVRRLLVEGRASASELLGENGSYKARDALFDFCQLCDHIGAEGSAYVSYLREAYVSPVSNQLRVTFDRQIEGGVYEPGTGLCLPAELSPTDIGAVVLELKFTDRFPSWMGEVVHALNLQACSVAKYVGCVDALDRDHQAGLSTTENGALSGERRMLR